MFLTFITKLGCSLRTRSLVRLRVLPFFHCPTAPVPISCWNLFYDQTFSFPSFKVFYLIHIPSLRRNTFPQKGRFTSHSPFFHSFSSIVLSFSLSFSVSCRHKIRINGKDILSLHQPFAITAVRCCTGLRIRV